MVTYSRQQREVPFILNGREIMNVTPAVVEHTETSIAELL